MNEQPAKRDWFYWFIALFTVAQIPFFVITATDFVLNPWAPDATYKSELYRLILGLIIVPVQIGISLLIIRRASTNVCGFFLLCWAISLTTDTLRVGTPIAPYYSLNYGWYGLWALLLFFPNGRIVPRVFEQIVRMTFVFAIFAGILSLLALPVWSRLPNTFVNPQSIPNPIFVSSLTGLIPLLQVVLFITLISWLILIVPLGVVRIKRSNSQERQQIKWAIWVFGILVIALFFQIASGTGSRAPETLNAQEFALFVIFNIFAGILPFVAIAYAILRHRLYDIDIIIRRTLIYSILSAILAGVYLGTVIFVQQLFQSATGDAPDFAIVLSTLLIAGLFTPVRRRVQDVIDRRFYRRKYNVEQTLAQFSQTLRDEVDIEVLKGQLVSVVQDTMQPSSIRLWVKE